ncbi:MAG TPA: universal stress protein [Longimicrobiales bacterium]|nr:universal stress protein [Longimicrobiales bacterium]
MATIERIAVPLDGSETAEMAFPLARTLARGLGVPIELIHVHGVTYGHDDEEGIEKEVVDAAQGYLEDKAGKLEEEGFSTRTTLLEGVVASELAGHLAGEGNGLIVMTTHGRSGMSRFWLGSTAETLVRCSPWPVLLVRPDQRYLPDSLDRVLVAVDGSERSEHALAWGRILAKAAGATVTLLQVVPDDKATSGAEEYLQGIARDGEEIATVTSESASGAILEEAKDRSAGLVALTTRGRGAVARTLFGSVADKVLRTAEVPLLVVNEEAED